MDRERLDAIPAAIAELPRLLLRRPGLSTECLAEMATALLKEHEFRHAADYAFGGTPRTSLTIQPRLTAMSPHSIAQQQRNRAFGASLRPRR